MKVQISGDCLQYRAGITPLMLNLELGGIDLSFCVQP